MQIKNGFVVRKIANSYMAVPSGSRTKDVGGVIALSETGAFLWKLLENDVTEEKLLSELLENYDITEEKALANLRSFLQVLQSEGWLDVESD